MAKGARRASQRKDCDKAAASRRRERVEEMAAQGVRSMSPSRRPPGRRWSPRKRCRGNAPLRSRSEDRAAWPSPPVAASQRLSTTELRDTCQVSIDHVIELQLLTHIMNSCFNGRYTMPALLQYVTRFFNDVWNLRVTTREENGAKGRAIHHYLNQVNPSLSNAQGVEPIPFRREMAVAWAPHRLRFLESAEKNRVTFAQASRFINALDMLLGLPFADQMYLKRVFDSRVSIS